MEVTRNVSIFLFVILCCTVLAKIDRDTLGVSCQKKCFTENTEKSTGILIGPNPQNQKILECVKQCLQDDRSPSKSKMQIVGPNDKVPKNLYMPKEIPPFPDKLVHDKDAHLLKNSECASQSVAPEGEPVPGEVGTVSVTCQVTGEGELQLMVQWSKPKEGSQFLQGYHLFYRFVNADWPIENHCRAVDKNGESFVINKKHGFHNGPVSVGVKALPTKWKLKLRLQKFNGCQGMKERIRSRRSLLPKGLSPPDFTNKSSKAEILWPIDKIPPGLVMPTEMVAPPLGRFEQNRTCRPPLLERRISAILSVSELRLQCENGANNTTKVAYAQWSMAGVKSNKVTGFQVLYSVMEDYNYDPSKAYCVEVGPGVRSVLIRNGISDNIKVRLNVAPLPIYSGQQLELNTYFCNTPKPGLASAPPSETSTPLAPIFGGVVAAVAVTAAVATWLFRRHKSATAEVRAIGGNGPKAYFSHCYRSMKDVKRLLTLADRLSSTYGIHCCIDLLEQRVIDAMTLSVWCNARLAESDKVIVVVDKKYLKIWDQHVKSRAEFAENGIEECKVLNELYYIQQHLMEKIERTAKVICLLTDGVQRTELPDFLRRRPVINWPNSDEAMADFVRCIMGLENNVLSC